jgi:hypothetical protein
MLSLSIKLVRNRTPTTVFENRKIYYIYKNENIMYDYSNNFKKYITADKDK